MPPNKDPSSTRINSWKAGTRNFWANFRADGSHVEQTSAYDELTVYRIQEREKLKKWWVQIFFISSQNFWLSNFSSKCLQNGFKFSNHLIVTLVYHNNTVSMRCKSAFDFSSVRGDWVPFEKWVEHIMIQNGTLFTLFNNW